MVHQNQKQLMSSNTSNKIQAGSKSHDDEMKEVGAVSADSNVQVPYNNPSFLSEAALQLRLQ